MSPEDMHKAIETKQWQLLQLYNFFRLFCVLIFLAISLYQPDLIQSGGYFNLLSGYLLFSLICLFVTKIKLIHFENQVLLFGMLDILFIVGLISFIGGLRSSFTILLNVTIAALSILVPGTLVLFFAAFASTVLLIISFIESSYGETPFLISFYISGLHGISLFATAIAVWYLAYRVRISETIAYRHGRELAGMQQINEYIIERLYSGVIYVDLDRFVYFINSAAKQFFNIELTEEITELKQLSAALDEKCLQFLQKIKLDNRPVQTVMEVPYLRIHFFASSVGPKTAVLIFLDDLSAIAQQAQQLKLSSLGRFSASIAHELRNPLGAISHAVQLMGEASQLSAEDLRMKQLIINNCNRMNGVIKNVLQLSRREPPHPQVIDFIPFIKQFKQDFCVYNQCNMIIEKIGAASVEFVFDKSQLEQILVILCENAIQHGSVNNQTLITINMKKTHLKTEIMVGDQGPGVPAHLKDAIFEPFFSTKRTGFGMGLFIAKELCEINQSRLELIPSEQGCCFAIIIEQTIGTL
ncbi:two-component system sensor kinase PilS [Legionella beliardensis]|uniref:histidine kinase n=1 Tax=Legionella beliardensis TaxID=91822 RepID=A0A378I087_9GAMM|nr:HAMP domain-containing sensor histidine kinase [Legionella beliardensis]STX28607.1 two-component system sensor kinase PilS [Legionella beliardensis]